MIKVSWFCIVTFSCWYLCTCSCCCFFTFFTLNRQSSMQWQVQNIWRGVQRSSKFRSSVVGNLAVGPQGLQDSRPSHPLISYSSSQFCVSHKFSYNIYNYLLAIVMFLPITFSSTYPPVEKNNRDKCTLLVIISLWILDHQEWSFYIMVLIYVCTDAHQKSNPFT